MLWLWCLLYFLNFYVVDKMSWINSLNKTIWSIVDPIINFFNSVRETIVFIFSTLWDLISWMWYGFNTLVMKSYEVFTNITWLSFFADNGDNISYLSSLLWGFSTMTLFLIVFCCMALIIVRFIYSLIPFFKSWRK